MCSEYSEGHSSILGLDQVCCSFLVRGQRSSEFWDMSALLWSAHWLPSSESTDSYQGCIQCQLSESVISTCGVRSRVTTQDLCGRM